VNDLNQLKIYRGWPWVPAVVRRVSISSPGVLVEAGVDRDKIRPAVIRPLAVEVPMKAIANQGGEDR